MDLKDVGAITCPVDGYVIIGEEPPYQFKFEVSKCNNRSEWFYVREDYDFVNVVQASVARELRPFVPVPGRDAIRGSGRESINVPIYHWVVLRNREGKSTAVYLADISGEGIDSTHIHLLYVHGAVADRLYVQQGSSFDLIRRIGHLEKRVEPALEDIDILKIEVQETIDRLEDLWRRSTEQNEGERNGEKNT